MRLRQQSLRDAPAVEVVSERVDIVRARYADEGLHGRWVPLRDAAQHAAVAGQPRLSLRSRDGRDCIGTLARAENS